MRRRRLTSPTFVAVCIVVVVCDLTSDGAAAPKGSPLARSASSTFGQRPTICYAGRLISHRRVQTCGVGLFCDPPSRPLPAGGGAFCVTELGRCVRGLVAPSCDVETSLRSRTAWSPSRVSLMAILCQPGGKANEGAGGAPPRARNCHIRMVLLSRSQLPSLNKALQWRAECHSDF